MNASDRNIPQNLADPVNLARAEEKLRQLMRDNAANNWPGLDRSPAARLERLHRWHRDLESDGLEGYGPPRPDSLFARLMQHYIAGDITIGQAATVNFLARGISND